jgi:hypothetical protein
MKKQILIWIFSAALFIFGTQVVYAADEPAKFSWHGYISQGITQSVDSNFITSDNDITGELTELGINGHYRLTNNLSVAGQVVYLDGGNRFEQGARVDYLFLDWSINDIWGWQGQVHLGRFKNRHWLYSVTRDVPQTRDTAVLPQSVYFDSFRDVALGSDGVQTSFKRYSNDNIWEVNWSYGSSDINEAQKNFLLGNVASGEIEQDFVHQFSVFWQPSTMAWKLGLSWLESDFTYQASVMDNRFDGKANIRRFMFSAQYFSENWELSSELLRDLQDSRGLFAPNFRERRTAEGGFVQFRYLFNSKVSGLVSYDTYVNNVSDPDGEQLEQSSFGQIPAYFGYVDTIAVGARWDFAPGWRIQAEHHWVEGATRAVSLLDPNIKDRSDKYWRMWSVQLMYWF